MVRRVVAVAFAVLAGVGVSTAYAPALSAQGLMITEIMAGKQTVLVDEDGDFSDWIEILNAGTSPVSLAGHSLTDDARELRKWLFPDLTLGPGRFLVVFASEKDRSLAGSELHTNFRLEEEGEILGLVAPDGVTVISKFDPQYPPQSPRVSYGFEMEASSTELVGQGATARFLVPADASAGAAWTAAGFDDAAWSAGATGIGFDKKTPATLSDLIRTDIQAQLDTVSAVVYVRIPFTVADPSAVSGLLLKMRYDDGFVAYVNGTEVARRNAPPAIAHTSRATIRRVEADVLVAEQINIASHIPALVPGPNLLAIAGLNISRLDPDFLVLPELSTVSVQSVAVASERYFSSPTPGLPNAGGAPAVEASPRLSRAGGLFPETFNLTLEASPGATIRYTVNGTEPTEASPSFTDPLPVDRTMIVKAKAYAPGLLPSRTATAFYVLADATVSGFNSNLPIVIIETFGKPINESIYTNVYATVIDVGQDGRSSASATAEYAGPAALKTRGSSSLQFPKKSYNFEIQDDEGGDQDVALLGMPSESDWILYAPYTDKTLMRDVLAYEWSNWIGRYAARTRFVEAFVHTSAGKLTHATGYVGVYVLSEKLKRGEDRINIQRLHASEASEPQLSGGYILKKDRLDPGDTGISGGGHTLGWVDPKEKEATAPQKSWIQRYLNEFAGVLGGAGFANPETGYAKYIDVGSFIDHHILVELTKNIDGYRLSTYMFKDRGEKLNMGPAWDYNLTLGNANYLDGWKPDGWYYALVGDGDYPWYRKLFQDPAFVRRYSERWVELRQGPLELARLLQSIDSKVQLLDEAQARNYVRWRILGTYVWPNWFIGNTFEAEIEFMRGWLEDRVAWMDSQLVPPPDFNQNGGQIPSDFRLTITSPAGTNVVYTTDGTDPKQADGGISPAALPYTGPIAITRNTRVKARTRIGDQVWGGVRDAVFVVEMPSIVITEIMYAPAPPPEGSPFSVHDFEFVEIKNTGTEPYDLRGLRFTKGITFDLASSAVATLAPGAYALVVRSTSAFASRYDAASMNVAGKYTGDLSNPGEVLGLEGPIGEPIHDFRYAASWYPETRDSGLSLVIVDATAPRERWGVKEGWRPSNVEGGSPGAADPDQPPAGGQIPGDFTQDGILGLTDATNLLGYLYLGEPSVLPCQGVQADQANLSLLDADRDGILQLTDGVHVLNFLFRGGPPPALGDACVQITGCADACVGP